MSRDELAKGIGQMAYEIDYSNFKDAVAKVDPGHGLSTIASGRCCSRLAAAAARGMSKGRAGWFDPGTARIAQGSITGFPASSCDVGCAPVVGGCRREWQHGR